MTFSHEVNLAWAAGFIDGEGCFVHVKTHRPNGKMYSDGVRLSAAQVNKEPLERLQKILGGKIYGPYKVKNNINARPFYQWVTKNNAPCLELLLPYLSSPKLEQYYTKLNAHREWRSGEQKYKRKDEMDEILARG